VADEMIADEHHGFDSFKETLRKDLEHVFFGHKHLNVKRV
jgi:hypothetical protein